MLRLLLSKPSHPGRLFFFAGLSTFCGAFEAAAAGRYEVGRRGKQGETDAWGRAAQ